MGTVAGIVAPSAVVAVMVMVDGPVGVGVGLAAVVHPAMTPAPITSKTSARYTGTRRNCGIRCWNFRAIASIESNAAATDQSR